MLSLNLSYGVSTWNLSQFVMRVLNKRYSLVAAVRYCLRGLISCLDARVGSDRRWWGFSWWSACWPPASCRGWLHIARSPAGSSVMAGIITLTLGFRVLNCALFTRTCPLFVFPVCADSNTHQKESCAPWPGSKCPSKTGGTGGIWGMVWQLQWREQHQMVTRDRLCLHALCVCVITRRQNGENKPLTVPKDIDLHLEKAPVSVIDALGKTNTPLTASICCSASTNTDQSHMLTHNWPSVSYICKILHHNTKQ